MIKIDNEFTVEAKAIEVWEVITQVDKYGDWNSFVSKCESSLNVGAPIKMRVHLFSFPITQKETILEHRQGEALNYGMQLPFKLLKSSRIHTVQTIDDSQVRYCSQFRLEGILSPLVALFMSAKLKKGFGRMTEEMRAELLRRQQQF